LFGDNVLLFPSSDQVVVATFDIFEVAELREGKGRIEVWEVVETSPEGLIHFVKGVSFEDENGTVEVWSRPAKDGEVSGVLVLKDDFGEFVYLLDNITTSVKEKPEGGGSGDGGEVAMELVVEVETVVVGG
jgi:hypothetical protein